MNQFSKEYLKSAHDSTMAHKSEILSSERCTCFFCGYQFDPNKEENLVWIKEKEPLEETLLCPMCYVDAVLGSASNFPIEDEQFILTCTTKWFNGISRISDKLEAEKIALNVIEVE